MVKRKEFLIVEDYKENNLWVKTRTETFSDHYKYKVTRSYQLWNSINKRCNKVTEVRKNRPWYLNSSNLFSDFQSFADWCQLQHGYNSKDENGNFWQLDKDLLVFGNKDYSPETCLFVPSKINSILLSSSTIRGEYPIGVTFNRRSGRFVAQSNDTSYKRKHLGYFDCPLEAHRAWQKFKMGRLLDEAKNEEYGIRLVEALLQKAEEINQDIIENKETILGGTYER